MISGMVGKVVLAQVPGTGGTGMVTGVPVGSGAEVRAHDRSGVKYVSRRPNDS